MGGGVWEVEGKGSEEENEGTRRSRERKSRRSGGRRRRRPPVLVGNLLRGGRENGKSPRESIREERCGSSEAMYSYIRVPSVQRSHSPVPGLAQVSDQCTYMCLYNDMPPPPGSKVSISQVPFPPLRYPELFLPSLASSESERELLFSPSPSL